MKLDFVLTTCPYCGCGCALFLEVFDGNIVNVLPCKTDLISEGTLCIKGRTAHEFVHHKKRLKKPLIRKKTGFREASWSQAIRKVISNFTSIKTTCGPNAIGVFASAKCTNEENFVLMKFTRAVIGTNNIDHCARLCHAPSVEALAQVFGSGAMTNSISEFENADCILIAGSNTIEQHPIIGTRIVRAKKKGAKIIVIDPRKTLLAEIGDVHLMLKPGTDVALLNGLMHVILSEALQDTKFISRRTENFKEFEKTILNYKLEKVERITEVPSYKIIDAARIYARARKAMIVYSMGITQHTTGTDCVFSIANLAMLTGNIGYECTGVNPLRGQNNVQGACDMGALPNFYSGYQPVSDVKMKLKFENAWKCELSAQPGLTLIEQIDAIKDGKIKALYIVGENPILSNPNIKDTKNALQKLDFLVVQDIFLTETAELADVVLPAASFAEKEGTFTTTDRTLRRVRRAIPPIGDARPDWQIICALAKENGAENFKYSSAQDIMTEIATLTPIYGGISYERLDSGEFLQWPCFDRKHKGTKYLHKNRFVRGKGRFVAVDYKEPTETADREYPFLLTTGRIMFHYHTGTMSRKTRLLAEEVQTGYIEINSADASELNINDGDIVTVSSRRGQLNVRALMTDRIRRKVVFMPFHFAECAANILTNNVLDPIAKIPELKVCAVRVEKSGK